MGVSIEGASKGTHDVDASRKPKTENLNPKHRARGKSSDDISEGHPPAGYGGGPLEIYESFQFGGELKGIGFRIRR